MKTYQVVGLLEPKQEVIIKNLKPQLKVSSDILRESTKLSKYEYNVAMQLLKQKGLIQRTKNPINKRTHLYHLTKKGENIRCFIVGEKCS